MNKILKGILCLSFLINGIGYAFDNYKNNPYGPNQPPFSNFYGPLSNISFPIPILDDQSQSMPLSTINYPVNNFIGKSFINSNYPINVSPTIEPPPTQIGQRKRNADKELPKNNKRSKNVESKTRSRKSCKIKLIDILKDGLEGIDCENIGLKWYNNKYFQINWNKFILHYQIRGQSDAKEASIKTRFFRKKNGFEKPEDISPDNGYDVIYSHASLVRGPKQNVVSTKSKKPLKVDAKPKQKRKHCKIDLFDIITGALAKNNSEDIGLKWHPRDESCFQVNWDKFIPFYQKRGNSNARKDSIKNRFTRDNNGFMKVGDIKDSKKLGKNLEDKKGIYPEKYFDAVYTHASFSRITINKTSSQIELKDDNDYSLNPSSEQPVTSMAPSLTEQRCVVDPIELLFKSIQQQNLKEDDSFDISLYLNKFSKDYNIYFTDEDKNNWDILLKSEKSTPAENYISIKNLSAFEYRFGKGFLISKIRDFVKSGAKNWYHGKLDKNEAEKILLENNLNDSFLIRAVPDDEIINKMMTPVFALTYRDSKGNIMHVNIYRDLLNELCVINKGKKIETFTSIELLIDRIVGDKARPVAAQQFANLMLSEIDMGSFEFDNYAPLCLNKKSNYGNFENTSATPF